PQAHPITSQRTGNIKRKLLSSERQLAATGPRMIPVLVPIPQPIPAMTIQATNPTNRQPISPDRHVGSPCRNKLASLIRRTITAREILPIPLTISASKPGGKQILARIIISHKPRTRESELANNRVRNLTQRRNHAISDRCSRSRNNHACKLQMRVSDRSRLRHTLKKQVRARLRISRRRASKLRVTNAGNHIPRLRPCRIRSRDINQRFVSITDTIRLSCTTLVRVQNNRATGTDPDLIRRGSSLANVKRRGG